MARNATSPQNCENRPILGASAKSTPLYGFRVLGWALFRNGWPGLPGLPGLLAWLGPWQRAEDRCAGHGARRNPARPRDRTHPHPVPCRARPRVGHERPARHGALPCTPRRPQASPALRRVLADHFDTLTPVSTRNATSRPTARCARWCAKVVGRFPGCACRAEQGHFPEARRRLSHLRPSTS